MNNTKFTETEVNSMRNRLQKLIQTLQNNKEQVPAKVLQTKYKKAIFHLLTLSSKFLLTMPDILFFMISESIGHTWTKSPL